MTDDVREPETSVRGFRLRRGLWIAGVALLVIVIGIAAWLLWPKQQTETVTLLGTEYTTNMQIEEHRGYVYVTIPVNSDTRDVVIEVPDETDNARIRDFLDELDTLVPGERVIALSDSNLHVLVDGIVE